MPTTFKNCWLFSAAVTSNSIDQFRSMHWKNVYIMYSFRGMRFARRVLRSRVWASSISTCHQANALRYVLLNTGNDAIHTTLRPFPCIYQSIGSRSVLWEHHTETLKQASKLFGFKTCTGTSLGLAVATSFLATKQGAIQCESHDVFHDGFQGNRQAQEFTEIITEDSLELKTQHKLLSFIKRYWWPTIFILSVIVGYPYPLSLLPNSLLLLWSTKPNPASIYLWLKKKTQTSQINQGALDRIKEKLNSSASVIHVEVQDCMLFCLAKITYLTSNTTMVGVLGDWWVISSSSSRITALGITLDNVPNFDNIAKDFRSKKDELGAEFKKVTEDGLKNISLGWKRSYQVCHGMTDGIQQQH